MFAVEIIIFSRKFQFSMSINSFSLHYLWHSIKDIGYYFAAVPDGIGPALGPQMARQCPGLVCSRLIYWQLNWYQHLEGNCIVMVNLNLATATSDLL